MSILKDCLQHTDLTVIFASWSEVLHLIKDSFDNKDSFYSTEYFMEVFRNTDLLVIDDIGSEKITEWSMSLLTEVLDARTKTIITTNLKSDEIRKNIITGHIAVCSEVLEKKHSILKILKISVLVNCHSRRSNENNNH